MQEAVKTNNLKVGMYVILPESWFNHPFARNEFLINSQEQIQKLLGSRIREVIVDTDKSTFSDSEKSRKQPDHTVKPISRTIVPDELREAIHDKNLPPQEKAKAVQQHSITLVSNLLENPTTENI